MTYFVSSERGRILNFEDPLGVRYAKALHGTGKGVDLPEF